MGKYVSHVCEMRAGVEALSDFDAARPGGETGSRVRTLSCLFGSEARNMKHQARPNQDWPPLVSKARRQVRICSKTLACLLAPSDGHSAVGGLGCGATAKKRLVPLW